MYGSNGRSLRSLSRVLTSFLVRDLRQNMFISLLEYRQYIIKPGGGSVDGEGLAVARGR